MIRIVGSYGKGDWEGKKGGGVDGKGGDHDGQQHPPVGHLRHSLLPSLSFYNGHLLASDGFGSLCTSLSRDLRAPSESKAFPFRRKCRSVFYFNFLEEHVCVVIDR